MATAHETLQQAAALLLEGKVQEAHDLVAAKVANPDPPPPPPPTPAGAVVTRPVPSWVSDIDLVAGLLGELLPLVEHFVTGFGSPARQVTALNQLKALHAGLTHGPADAH